MAIASRVAKVACARSAALSQVVIALSRSSAFSKWKARSRKFSRRSVNFFEGFPASLCNSFRRAISRLCMRRHG